jgi:hypothetical protein
MSAMTAVTAVSFSPLHSQSGEAHNNHHASHAPTPLHASGAGTSPVAPQPITNTTPPMSNGSAPSGNNPGPAVTTNISQQAHNLSPPAAPSTASDPPPSPAAQSYAESGAPVSVTGEGGQASHYA